LAGEGSSSLHLVAVCAESIKTAAEKAAACAARPDFKVAAEFAERSVNALETFDYGIKVGRRELLAMHGIEELGVMLRRYGRNAVVDGINHATSNKLKQPDGHVISGWTFFEPYIKEIAATKPKPPAPIAEESKPTAATDPAWHRWVQQQERRRQARGTSAAADAAVQRAHAPAAIMAQPPERFPVLRALLDADAAQNFAFMRANRKTWTRRLHAFFAEQRTKHGCTEEEVVAVMVDIARKGALAEDVASLRGSGSQIVRLQSLFASIAAAMERQREAGTANA
jgi:hypothetical protein